MEKSDEKVKEIGELMKVKKGRDIYQAGEEVNSFYYIEKGIVKIAADSLDGKSTTVSINGSSEFIGYLDSLLGKKEYTTYAVTLTDCTIYAIPIEFLSNMFVRENYIFNAMAYQLEKAQELNFVLSTMTVPERLRWLLKKIANRKGDVFVIEHPLTHEEMANYLGCSRQKVSNYISKWKKEGRLTNENGTIKILNEETLQ